MRREKHQIRMHTLTDERQSPLKFPSVQQINKTIQGEDGTIFTMNQLMNRANIGNRTIRTLQKITNEQSERKDLQLISQWTDSMVQQIQNQNFYSITEFYDKIELIYSGSIGQLCQQLSVKCNDYSTIIDKIWSSYTGTVKEIIEKQSRTNRKLEKDNLTNTIKIHEMYQVSMTDKLQRLQEAEKSSKRNVEYAEKLSKENRYLRKKTLKMQSEITHLNNNYDLLKLQMQDLCKENETLKLFQQVRHLQQGSGTEFEEELYKAKREIFDDFKQVFEEQTRKFEEAYQNKMLELEKNIDDKAQRDENIGEDYEDILFKDQCVGNSCEFNDIAIDTADLIQREEMFTQTLVQKKKMYDWSTQTVPPPMTNQASEANYATIKRECIPRNQEEQTYLEMSHYPIKAFLDDYYQLYINRQEIEKKTFQEIFDSILDKLKFRSSQIFNILRMKEEFQSDDFIQVDQYVQNSYQVFIYLTHDFQEVIRKLKDELIARKIQIYETQIDCKQTNRQKVFTDKKFDTLAAKYQTSVKNYNFIERQLKDSSRHIPQYQLDQIRRKALRHKIHIEFPKGQSPNPNISTLNNQMLASSSNIQLLQSVNNLNPPNFVSQQNLMPPHHQSTSPNLLLSAIPQRSFGFFPPMTPLEPTQELSIQQRASLAELSCDSPETSSPQKPQITLNFFPDKQFEESLSSSDDEIDLSECLNPVKNLLSIEKKLFVSKCPSKNTNIATQTLTQEIQQFRRDKIENIVTQGTLIKQLSNFISWCLKFNKFNYPLHVQLYEYFSAENQSQPQNVWLGKVGRVVKSLIYFKRKNDTARLFHAMLIGDVLIVLNQLNFQIYLQVLSNIQNPQFTDTGIQVLQSSMADFVKGVPKYPQYVDYDVEISHYLGPMQDTKIQELLLKYSMILQIFEGERLTLNQFRLLMLELENKKEEQWIINLFNTECDIEQASIQYMSFQRFAVICEEFQLLQNLDDYINQNNAQYFRDMELWKLREIELKLMLIRSHNYDAAERDLFLRMHKLHQPSQHIILGRFLERRAKELLIQQYALECLAPFMLLFES